MADKIVTLVTCAVMCGVSAMSTSCARTPRPTTPMTASVPVASASPSTAEPARDAGVDALPPLPFQLQNLKVRDPGYSLGLAREWKVCVLDTMRDRDLRCGKELLWENEDLPKYQVSDACRATEAVVGASCRERLQASIDAAAPSTANIAKCRDDGDDGACARIDYELKNPLFANRGSLGCTNCGRQAKDFPFGASRPEPVPALDALPFTQDHLDALYENVDAAIGAVDMYRCARPSSPTDCTNLQRSISAHPAHPDVAIWQRTIAQSRGVVDELTWVDDDRASCVRQRDDADEMACASIRSYLELFPNGKHVREARVALARAEPQKNARVHAEQVEGCKRTCAAPPRDWNMGSGPKFCARILGHACR